MNTHRTDLSIDSLQKAFSTAFNWVVGRDRESEIDDFPAAWVELVASALQDVRLTATPAIDSDSPPLKFLQTHRITTELFVAVAMRWFTSEHTARRGIFHGPYPHRRLYPALMSGSKAGDRIAQASLTGQFSWTGAITRAIMGPSR